MTLGKRPFENIVGKRENAGNHNFLLFPQCFLPFPKQISTFWLNDLLSANALNLNWSKIYYFEKSDRLSSSGRKTYNLT